MSRLTIAFVLFAAPVFAQAPAPAAQANPAPGCSATPAQLEANRKVAMEFFRVNGADRVALADPSYKQHNPAFKKRAEDNKVSDYEEFKAAFAAPPGGWNVDFVDADVLVNSEQTARAYVTADVTTRDPGTGQQTLDSRDVVFSFVNDGGDWLVSEAEVKDLPKAQ